MKFKTALVLLAVFIVSVVIVVSAGEKEPINKINEDADEHVEVTLKPNGEFINRSKRFTALPMYLMEGNDLSRYRNTLNHEVLEETTLYLEQMFGIIRKL